jgi:hypothetical protein
LLNHVVSNKKAASRAARGLEKFVLLKNGGVQGLGSMRRGIEKLLGLREGGGPNG